MTFLERLRERAPILTDGGTGAERRRTGKTAREVHVAFAEAGAEVIVADTITLTGSAGAEPTLAGSLAEALADARAAAGPRVVAVSLGPSLLEDGPARTRAWETLVALAARGADVLFAETLLRLEDADAAVIAARHAGLPVAVSFAFGRSGFGYAGLSVEDAARWAVRAQPDAAGFNCGDDPPSALAAAEHWVRIQREVPLVFRPAAGATSPADFAAVVARARALGARVVGGCCGAGPTHVSALREALRTP